MDKLENFKIDKIIFHEIYKKDSEIPTPPFFSEKVTNLDLRGRYTLQDRVIKALGHKSTSIQMDIVDESEDSMFRLIKDFFLSDQSEKLFIELSKNITKKLASSQTKRNIPGGAVITLLGTVQESNKQCICIIKAEKQSGFSIAEESKEKILKYFDELLLTPHQKLHKIGFFINNAVKGRNIDKTDMDVFVFDSNTNTNATLPKASYFYSSFLGLDFKKESNLFTKDFYYGTQTFVNAVNEINGIKKAEVITELISYLKNDVSALIEIQKFANRCFTNAEIRDKYIKFLEGKNVPTNGIRKDLSLIDKKLKKRKMNFDNSVVLQIPSSDFGDTVEMTENENGDTIITIKGRMLNES